ncbi:hypothetical protein ACFQ5B_17100 [Laceyella putida]|uniref:Uncharacterized protein n=2 Tax=Laceyella putida TaxID=110101 RepID=A0ABW2RH65_9BACL
MDQKQIFAVHRGHRDIYSVKFIRASSAEEALEVGERLFIQSDIELFEEDVYDTAINGFAESFYYRDGYREGEALFDENFRLPGDMETIRPIFERNVREFFDPHQDWADLYIQHTYIEMAGNGSAVKFPSEMIEFFIRKDDDSKYIAEPIKIIDI